MLINPNTHARSAHQPEYACTHTQSYMHALHTNSTLRCPVNTYTLQNHSCILTYTCTRTHRHTHPQSYTLTYTHTRSHAQVLRVLIYIIHTILCVRKHKYAHTHTHAHRRTHICTHTHTNTHIHTYTLTCVHEHTHIRTSAHTHSHTHTHTHTHKHTRTHTRKYIYARTRTSLLHLNCAAIGRLCEKCDGKCPICDSYVRPATLVRVCEECNYGSYEGRCVICGGVGVSDAYYCKECTLQEKDVGGALAGVLVETVSR